ncbi:hypothetical protein L210DRAFT_3518318 [Boletus edulis BED1]|uniref:Uncharacterized protein n=1 Tax=Boletus edulis BED1 TaxID=1328754 RepID=A0AAD4C9E2_BOLED|nr:hypothetical protein L210DRAFT_3518318 [Boletus edulis BED1]
MLIGGCFVLSFSSSAAFECSRNDLNDPVTTGELYQYGRLSLVHEWNKKSYAFPQTCLGFRSHPPCDSNDIPAHPVIASDLSV